MNPPRPPGTQLQRRILALLDDHTSNGDHITAEGQRAATLMDREFELRMRRFLTFLEPVLTIFLGGVIGLLLMALYLPIFGLSSALTR